MKYTRRQFIKHGSLGALAVSLGTGCSQEDAVSTTPLDDATGMPPATPPVAPPDTRTIPTRKLGKTGRTVTLLGIGGTGTLQQNPEPAIAIIHRALELGITYLDTAQNYGHGQSEKNYGEALVGVDRDSYYLNTKIWVRDYDSAARLIDETLTNLRLDHVDCMMLHGIGSANDVETALGANGAMKAIEKARDEGKTKLIGFSGHNGPEPLQLAMDRYDFDVALMAINPADQRKRSYEHTCYAQAVKAGIGIINMKPLGGGGGMIRSRGGVFEHHELLHYGFSLPGHVTITCVNTLDELEQAVAAAKSFKPITPEQKSEMETRALDLALNDCLGFRSDPNWTA